MMMSVQDVHSRAKWINFYLFIFHVSILFIYDLFNGATYMSDYIVLNDTVIIESERTKSPIAGHLIFIVYIPLLELFLLSGNKD
jgi:hypothetical protein